MRGAGLLVAGSVAAGCALAAAGGALALAAWRERARGEAEVDGLALRLRSAVWRDHVALDRDPLARALLPGTPEHGFQRLAVRFSVENRGGAERRFTWQDLALRWPRHGVFAASRDGRASVAVPPGHAVLLEASFDVPETDEALALVWERGSAPAKLLATRVPAHAPTARPGALAAWPRTAAELPAGRAAAGAHLFTSLSCAACHGDPAAPGSSGAAPHLAAIGTAAATRVRGASAAQYLYESIVDPGAYVARSCAGAGPCPDAPPMPSYGEVLSLQDAADLVAYLLSLRGAP